MPRGRSASRSPVRPSCADRRRRVTRRRDGRAGRGAVTLDAGPVAAAGVVAPAPGAVARRVDEDEPAVRVATDLEAVPEPDDLEQRRQQVVDEPGPVRGDTRDPPLAVEAEPGSPKEPAGIVRPASGRVAQAPDHLP